MNRHDPGQLDLDETVRRALGGEPSQDTEERLRASLRPAWRRLPADTRPGAVWCRLLPATWPLPLPRAALAVLSACMILAGAGWNLAHPPQAAASALSSTLLARQVAQAAAAASAMRCSVDTRGDDGRLTTALIEWRAGRGSEVRVGTAPAVTLAETDLTRSETVLSTLGPTGHASRTPRDLECFLSPGNLAARLDGTWELVSPASETTGATYRIERSAGHSATVTLDRESGLPRYVAAPPDISARCTWTAAPPTGLLLGGAARSASTPSNMEDPGHDH